MYLMNVRVLLAMDTAEFWQFKSRFRYYDRPIPIRWHPISNSFPSRSSNAMLLTCYLRITAPLNNTQYPDHPSVPCSVIVGVEREEKEMFSFLQVECMDISYEVKIVFFHPFRTYLI